MTTRRTLFVGLAVAAFVGAFLVYGIGRALAETVGVTWEGTRTGVLFVGILGLGALAIVLLAYRLWSGGKSALPTSYVVVLGLGMAMGCLVSELQFLHDESGFASEVAREPSVAYDRPRAWPFKGAALIYIPGKGTHANN